MSSAEFCNSATTGIPVLVNSFPRGCFAFKRLFLIEGSRWQEISQGALMKNYRFLVRTAGAVVLLRPWTPGPKFVPTNAPPCDDYFAGLTLSGDQQTKVDEIHRKMRMRKDAVVSEDKLDMDQKNATLDGYRRMEINQIFEALTAEQQGEVRKRVVALRAAAKREGPTVEEDQPSGRSRPAVPEVGLSRGCPFLRCQPGS
jgi:hypothetical protein